MATTQDMSLQVVHHVRDTCFCLHAQRYARAVARRFDEAFRPLALTNGQYSLLMALHRPQPVPMTPVAELLGMDRTTLTAALKPLAQRGWVRVLRDPDDGRSRLLQLTPDGRAVLKKAVPIWRRVQADVQAQLSMSPERFRKALRTLG